MSDFVFWAILISVLWNLVFGLVTNADGFVASLLFKAIPTLIGIALIIVFLIHIGWIRA